MKTRTFFALFLTVVCLAALASAQNAPAADKKDPLTFVQTAVDIAYNLHHGSLDNYLGLYVDANNWASGLKDGDLGPFLKGQEAKPTRSAACLFSSAKDGAVCVYFDGDKAYGAVSVHAVNGKMEDKDVTAAYKPVTKELLEKNSPKLRFDPAGVNTDDGAALPGFAISLAPQF